MKALPPPAGLEESDFERIEAAVMETERGRWFLAEYARRIREDSLNGVMASLGRIEQMIAEARPSPVAEAERRLASQVRAIEERLQDLAWRLQEQEDDFACAAVEAEIFALRALTAPPADEDPTHGREAVETAPGLGGSLSQRLASIERARRPDVLDAVAMSAEAVRQPVRAISKAGAFAEVDALSTAQKLAYFA